MMTSLQMGSRVFVARYPGAVVWCGRSERVAMPHPGALGVVEPVREPLVLQQLQTVRRQVEGLAASVQMQLTFQTTPEG